MPSCPMSSPVNAMTRRGFHACLAGLPAWFRAALAANTSAAGPWDSPAVVARVYLAAERTHWPRPNLDVPKVVAEVDARLKEVERKHAGALTLTGGETLLRNEDVAGWAAKHAAADAVLLIPVSTPSVAPAAVAGATKLPCLCFSRPYAGHQWSGIAGLRHSGLKIDVLASSSYHDLDAWVPVFRAIHHLKTGKVLVASNAQDRFRKWMDGFRSQFGTGMQFLTYEDLQAAYDKADPRQAERDAASFTRAALRVVEPTPKEVQDAMRFSLAANALLAREKANALTVDCFPGLLAHKMPAYPCIAWSLLNDRGLYGVCEGDIRSTMTQMLVTSATGMPGFVSDPVFDTSRNEVIHAHCVAATKMKGINGPAAPYLIRHHLETAEGATLQVLMPVGETITVAEFADPQKLLVSTAEVTGTTAEVDGSPDAEYGCRSKIRTRVPDAARWLESYGSGLHRVIFYGDHLALLGRMSRMMGFQMVREA